MGRIKKILTGILALAMSFSVVPVSTAYAASEISVSSVEEMQTALENVGDGDVIKLTADLEVGKISTSRSGLFTVNSDITVDMNGHTISANGAGLNYLFDIESDNFTLKNGTIDGMRDSVSLSTFVGVRCSVAGANVVLDTVTIRNCDSNTINVTRGANLKMVNCTIKENFGIVVDFEGKNSNETFEMNNCVVRDNTHNTSSGEGCAIVIRNASEAIINNSTFDNNTTTCTGAGFFTAACNDVKVLNSTFTNNDLSLSSGIGTENTINVTGGAGFCVYNNAGDVLIENNTFTNNKGREFGGGFSVWYDKDDTSYIVGELGDVTIVGNILTNNEVFMSGTPEISKGGGFAVYDAEYSHSTKHSCILIDNVINNNTAGTTDEAERGGAISLYANDETNYEFVIYSGEMKGNTAGWGGAIDYTFKESCPLYLLNVLITDNTAVRGGGIWLCPTSITHMNSTLGGAIYGNHATGTYKPNSAWTIQSTGDDIRYEGTDTDLPIEEYDSEEASKTSVMQRSLGDAIINWYSDDQNARYSSGAGKLVDVEKDYTNRSTSFGLHGELDSDGIAKANADAKLVISGNTASMYGGAIASNSAITFGMDEDISARIIKKWQDADGNEISGTEPITVSLVRVDANGNEEVVDTVTLSQSNNYQYEFNNLESRYITIDSSTGTITYHNYSYTAIEQSVDGYTGSISTAKDGNDFVITLTNKEETEQPPEIQYINIPISKVWVDEDDKDGIRPDSIEIILHGSDGSEYTATLSEENNWAYEFKNLPVSNESGDTIEYTMEEISVDGYSVSYSGNATSGIVITNTHNVDRTQYTVSKVWADEDDKDGIRPESIDIMLIWDGEEYYTTLSEENDWTYTFTDLVPGGFESIEEINVPDGYVQEVESGSSSAVITNTHEIERTEYTVSKIWADEDDKDGIRPESIDIVLTWAGEEFYATLSEENDWTHTFTDLIPDGFESIEEINVPDGYVQEVNEYTDRAVITNTHEIERTEYIVSKVWDDEDDKDGIRPDSIDVVLTWAGEEFTATLSEENNWTYTFTDLVLDGFESIEEVDVPEGYAVSVDPDTDSAVITNIHEVERIEYTVSKVWNDMNDYDGIRPESIEIMLKWAGEELYATLSEENGWTYTFIDLTLGGFESIEEVNVPEGYVDSCEATETGGIFTNTHVPETFMPVYKVWNDMNDADGIRPESLEVVLTGSDGSEYTATLSEENDWQFVFEGLSVDVTYNLAENDIPEGYESEIVYDEDYGYIITNTHTATTPSTITFTINKVWDDEDDTDGIRPDEITFIVANDAEEDIEVQVTEADGWTKTLEDLTPDVAYTITENVPYGYEADFDYTIDEDGNITYTVTNTHIPDTEQIFINENDEETPSDVEEEVASKTGDTAQTVILLVIILATTAAVVTVVLVSRKKEKKN